jgi:hypothetical protein
MGAQSWYGWHLHADLQVPFSDRSGAVASGLEELRDGVLSERETILRVDVEVRDHAIAHTEPRCE